MANNSIAKRFSDEDRWTFVGRGRELKQCLAFLEPRGGVEVPSRLLWLSGESGAGKSFFAKELICHFARQSPSAITLYINLEESEFESAGLEKRLTHLVSYSAEPTRKNPQQVPPDAVMSKHLRPLPFWLRSLQYTYGGLKESTKQIPFVGKIISAFLPKEVPVSKRRELAAAGRVWDYLIVEAHRIPVLLIIDNFQFLPDSMAMEIDSLLATAETGFRLAVVERTRAGSSNAWDLRCFPEHRLSVRLNLFSYAETSSLVRSILGKNFPDLEEITDVIYRKSGGNAKQIWLQLRSLQSNFAAQSVKSDERQSLELRRNNIPVHVVSVPGDYEETIVNLPPLDRMSLQIITLMMGGIKMEDLVGVLHFIVNSVSETDIKKTIRDLALVGLLIVNGTQNNRVKIEHELVTLSVRRTTTEEEALSLRLDVVSALSHRLDQAPRNEEYDRLVDRLIGLVSPQELRSRHDLLAHLITLIDKQSSKERFHYLIWLFSTPLIGETIDLIPSHCLEAFLDAFQKTSQFDKGLAAVELVQKHEKLPKRELSLYSARYLVQKFEYERAETLLKQTERDSETEMILFNILLNLCRDDEALRMIELIVETDANEQFDEFQCVMLRNCNHLYAPETGRKHLLQAKNGFSKLGLAFGEASTCNNLGVLEAWAGNYEDAQKHLDAARSAFERLDSNEIYQPLTNLAILRAVKGDAPAANQLLAQAKTAVSPWLQMDDAMLEFNQLMIDLMTGEASGRDAVAKAEELYERSHKIMDLRFKAALAWFADQMRSKFGDGAENVGLITVPPEFETHIHDTTRSGLEIFSEAMVDGQNVQLVFILSPHWRY